MSDDREEVRQHLIDLCERGVVPQEHWSNRDTPGAQEQLGRAWVLLSAGCDFTIDTSGDDFGGSTIWVRITHRTFTSFDGCLDDHACRESHDDDDLFYLPTDKGLRAAAGRDWY